jgi:hypothetical protein
MAIDDMAIDVNIPVINTGDFYEHNVVCEVIDNTTD